MIQDIVKHKTAYSLLAVLSGAYLVFVYRYQTTPLYLLLGTAVFALTYFLWGVVHHAAERSLHLRIVLEYFLVSALAVLIMATLLV